MFALFCLIAVFFFLKELTSSSYGVLIKSIKEDEERVKFLGYNTSNYKLITFVISTALTAFAGGLTVLNYGYMTTGFIDPGRNVEVIFAVLIGGPESLYGAIIGGVVYMIISNFLAIYIPRWEMFLGIALLIIVFRFRTGVFGFINERMGKTKTEGYPMIPLNTIAYGLTIGGILYIISIGLSLTFGTMRIVNFAHPIAYTLGAYFLITILPLVQAKFFLGAAISVLAVIPIGYLIERIVVRKLTAFPSTMPSLRPTPFFSSVSISSSGSGERIPSR